MNATTTRPDPLQRAYAMLWDYRDGLRHARCSIPPVPAKAFRLAQAALQRGGERGAALQACEEALADWCAGGFPATVARCQPVLDAIRAELAGEPAAT